MRESDVHKALVARIEALGGSYRRAKWQARNGAPDVLILLPGRHTFIEEKRPGKAPTEQQAREHVAMRAANCEVLKINNLADIDHYFPIGDHHD